MSFFSGNFAGVNLTFNFTNCAVAQYYGEVLASSFRCNHPISVPEREILDWMKRWNVTDSAYVEYVISCSYACDFLLRNQRLVFHGAAFLWKGKAYLFSAPSGTGKTTQLRLWKELFPSEVEILNGDKPILQLNDSDNPQNVLVHPSPWKGKEGLGRDDIVAPLGGIILLRQDIENLIKHISPSEAARYLFGRIYSTFNTEREVIKAAELLESILEKTPVWLLRNKGDRASALLTYQTLIKEEI